MRMLSWYNGEAYRWPSSTGDCHTWPKPAATFAGVRKVSFWLNPVRAESPWNCVVLVAPGCCPSRRNGVTSGARPTPRRDPRGAGGASPVVVAGAAGSEGVVARPGGSAGAAPRPAAAPGLPDTPAGTTVAPAAGAAPPLPPPARPV